MLHGFKLSWRARGRLEGGLRSLKTLPGEIWSSWRRLGHPMGRTLAYGEGNLEWRVEEGEENHSV